MASDLFCVWGRASSSSSGKRPGAFQSPRITRITPEIVSWPWATKGRSQDHIGSPMGLVG